MERLLEDSIAYAKQREQFGQPIARHPEVADKLVDMKVSIEAGRLLLYRAAAVRDAGGDGLLEAAIAKLSVSEAHVRQALAATARLLTDTLAVKAPGGSVEVRVPPFAVAAERRPPRRIEPALWPTRWISSPGHFFFSATSSPSTTARPASRASAAFSFISLHCVRPPMTRAIGSSASSRRSSMKSLPASRNPSGLRRATES